MVQSRIRNQCLEECLQQAWKKSNNVKACFSNVSMICLQASYLKDFTKFYKTLHSSNFMKVNHNIFHFFTPLRSMLWMYNTRSMLLLFYTYLSATWIACFALSTVSFHLPIHQSELKLLAFSFCKTQHHPAKSTQNNRTM